MLQAVIVIPVKVKGYVLRSLIVWKPLSHILSNYLFVIRQIFGILDVKSILKQ